MMAQGKMEWTEVTWSPVAGCTVISRGCTNCYAMRLAARLSPMGHEAYALTTRRSGRRSIWTGQINSAPDVLDLSGSWRTERMAFVNSMSDLFYPEVPEPFIEQVFRVMDECRQHTFQILKKRAERLAELAPRLPWPENGWMGVSIENAQYPWRADYLRRVSLEPLLGPLYGLNMGGHHWVIAGGESGPGARLMDPEWVRNIRDLCSSAGVPFFFKQWGGTNKKMAGGALDGRMWNQFPPNIDAR
jgi:protein gp37